MYFYTFLKLGSTSQWRTQKISDGVAMFRHNRVTSKNFRGSAEGTTMLGGSGACPRENFAKLHLKTRIFMHSGSKFSMMLLRDLLAGETEN